MITLFEVSSGDRRQIQSEALAGSQHVGKTGNKISVDFDAFEEHTCVEKLVVVMQ